MEKIHRQAKFAGMEVNAKMARKSLFEKRRAMKKLKDFRKNNHS